MSRYGLVWFKNNDFFLVISLILNSLKLILIGIILFTEHHDSIYSSWLLFMQQASELHFNEPWFHGELKGGRGAAEAQLRAIKYVENDRGVFLWIALIARRMI